MKVDWSKAEPWAKYHVINPMGWGMWLARPLEQNSTGQWVNLGYWESSYIDGPVREDWQNTLETRPEVKHGT